MKSPPFAPLSDTPCLSPSGPPSMRVPLRNLSHLLRCHSREIPRLLAISSAVVRHCDAHQCKMCNETTHAANLKVVPSLSSPLPPTLPLAPVRMNELLTLQLHSHLWNTFPFLLSPLPFIFLALPCLPANPHLFIRYFLVFLLLLTYFFATLPLSQQWSICPHLWDAHFPFRGVRPPPRPSAWLPLASAVRAHIRLQSKCVRVCEVLIWTSALAW